jgi:hypothetical protein
MTATAGMTDADPRAGFRGDACHFSDDRLSSAQKLGFVHELLGRDMAEVRMFLDQLEKYSASLDDAERQAPPVAAALAEIAADQSARERYLEFARDADEPAVRARMLALARGLGWLTPAEQRAELMRMFGERLARKRRGFRGGRPRVLAEQGSRAPAGPASAAAVARAGRQGCQRGRPRLPWECRGHARVLRALTSPNDDDVQIAQIYLRHRPLADANELRVVATGITRMSGSEAQVRALDTLAGHRLSDRESLEELTRLFPLAKSVNVQRAIAGILIRSDYQSLARPELARALRQHRLKSPDGQDMIDVLIRRLEAT